MHIPTILVLATGGTIAGRAGSATKRDYRPGQIEIDAFLQEVGKLGLNARLIGRQIANIGSEDIGPAIWRELYDAAATASSDPAIDAIIITHGTDTAEETAFLLDLTLPASKPVVLVGAMRPADAVGSDGLRNFAIAMRVAADPAAAGRGVLLVMGEEVLAARDARKARTTGTNAFAGFPRGAIGLATPTTLDWLGAPWRTDEAPRHHFPKAFPPAPILHAYAGMGADCVTTLLEWGARGIVLAGFGDGNAPEVIRSELSKAVTVGVMVVRSSRVDAGLVDRDGQDDALGFVAARALGPAKARILTQLLIAEGVTDPAEAQAAFDRR